jgi:hypothetical protein
MAIASDCDCLELGETTAVASRVEEKPAAIQAPVDDWLTIEPPPRCAIER